MFGYPLFFIMHFCYEKNVQFLDRYLFCIIEEIRKNIFKLKFKPKYA